MRYSFLVNLIEKLSKLVNMCKNCYKMFTATSFVPHSVHCECKERFLCPTVYIVNAKNVFMPHSVHCECKERFLCLTVYIVNAKKKC